MNTQLNRAGSFFRSLLPLIAFAVSVLAVSVAMADEAAPAEAAKPENYLHWVMRSSGLIGLVILGLSLYFVATVTRLFFELRMQVAAPSILTQSCNLLIQQRDLRGAQKLARESPSFLGRILTAAIPELPQGISQAREALDRASEAETLELEKQISMLAVLGTLGPMIGLLGTLKGMISSFSVIAMSEVQMKASEVAGGISEALLLTFEGVALSVPAIYFFALFRNRVATISNATTLQGDEILRQMHRAARNKGSGPPMSGPPGAAVTAGV